MTIAVNTISFTSQQRPRRDKDAEKKVVTGGGAIAATTAAANLKGAKSGLNMVQRTTNGLKTVTGTTKTATTAMKKTKGLWAKVAENAKWAKDAILNFGSKFKNIKWVKPIVNSPIFKKCAGFLGYGFGAVTLISGMSDIVKVTTDSLEGNFSKD